MACDPHWTAYLTALMTPTVAAFGIYIGWQQWRTAQNKLKLELFERRFHVYDTARSFLGSIVTTGKASNDEIYKFLSGTRESKWLLNSEVDQYFEKHLYHNALALYALQAELEGVPAGEGRRKNVERQSEIKTWFNEQYGILDQKFAEFLQLKH